MCICICICICIVIFQWWCPHSSVLYGLRKNVTGRETSLEEDIKQGFLSNPAPENPDYDEDLCLGFVFVFVFVFTRRRHKAENPDYDKDLCLGP